MIIPSITDHSIREAATKLGIRLDDHDRVRVLREHESADIWACPGSGKTTLLGAKLYLLATQWVLPHRGICALSHTNVAKEEITNRLVGTPARKLLSAPHFVDTIQRFVHEFLAIPALVQKFGVRPRHMMSNEQFAAEMNKSLQQPQYTTARKWLERQSNPDEILAKVRFSGTDLKIEVPRLKDHEGPSYGAIKEVKLTLASRGLFTYRDMYPLGSWYIATYPVMVEVLAHRFPIVFFDETQDTDAEQWQLLSSIFDGRSVVQRFGDHNQAIFETLSSESSGCDFPRKTHLQLSKSMRYSRSIARLVENLSLTAGVTLIGNEARPDRDHAIIQFDPLTAHLVLPRYAAYVLDQFNDRTDEIQAYAVGAIGKSASNDHFPACIAHYWADYEHKSNFSVRRPTCFAEHILLAQSEVAETGSVQKGIRLLAAAVAEVLRLENCRIGVSERLGPDLLMDTLRLTSPAVWNDLSAAFVEVLSFSRARDDREVIRELKLIGPVIIQILGRRPGASKPFFMGNPTGLDELTPPRSAQSRNRFHFEKEGKSIDVQVGTIHSVKGQSHDATLVLETRYRTYDLDRCKLFLLGERPKRINISDSRHLRRVYVGVTRPRELLALAMQRDHLTEDDRLRLQDLGWHLLEVE